MGLSSVHSGPHSFVCTSTTQQCLKVYYHTIQNIASFLPSKLLEKYRSLTNLCLQKKRTLLNEIETDLNICIPNSLKTTSLYIFIHGAKSILIIYKYLRSR